MIDVLICGAGAAGLTLALECARRNVPFQLIEKSPMPFGGSRGKGIQPRTLEIFEDLGIADRIAAAGGLYPLQRLHKIRGHIDAEFMQRREPAPSEPYANPLMVPQFRTEAILRARLAEFGHAVRFGCELTGFTQTGDRVQATVNTDAGRETIEARYLVGTDGGRSFVRQALGIDFPGKTLGMRAIVADLRIAGLDPGFWHRWGEGTMDQIGLCPLRGTDLFQLQGPVPPDGDIDVSVSGIAASIAHRTGDTNIVVRDVTWASIYAMNARLADHYRRGRIFLAGDAAHIHPPTGGQGLNTSIQDAYNLGWKLAAVLRGAPEVLLASYETERRPVAEDVLGLSTKLLDAARLRGDMRRGRETQQLDLGYPDSPLSFATHARDPKSSLFAGDRAPDAPCIGAGGQPTRLFNLFRGPHWTLLGLGVSHAIEPRPVLHTHIAGPGGDILDCGGHIRAAYGGPGRWILVRPDGYLAALVEDGELPALQAHMRTVLF
jgi:2-polyprenyl-6-methoxyphenol hydroxylase-like FAD-dependent oxidoreductase